MTNEYVVVVFVGILVGILQGVIIILLNIGVSKIKIICQQIERLQTQMTEKVDLEEHKKIELQLGKFGDRILTLELAVKVIEKEAT